MNLGVCHELGVGATKSYEDAQRLYEQALALGQAQAAEALKRLGEKIHTECPLLGKRVSITGTSREDLNGRTGVATSFDHAGGRYVVELDSEGKSISEPAKLRQLRLKPVHLTRSTRKKKQQGS